MLSREESLKSFFFMSAGEFWGIEYSHSVSAERKLENGDYAYLGEKTLMPCDYKEYGENFSFPGRLFEGLTLGFEMALAEKSIPGELRVNLFRLKDKISAAALVDIAGKTEIEAGHRLQRESRKLSTSFVKILITDGPSGGLKQRVLPAAARFCSCIRSKMPDEG